MWDFDKIVYLFVNVFIKYNWYLFMLCMNDIVIL